MSENEKGIIPVIASYRSSYGTRGSEGSRSTHRSLKRRWTRTGSKKRIKTFKLKKNSEMQYLFSTISLKSFLSCSTDIALKKIVTGHTWSPYAWSVGYEITFNRAVAKGVCKVEFPGPCIPRICNWPKSLVFDSDVTCTYHLLTESEVITGKSQTSALMYWPSDSEVDTSRPRSEISL